MIWIRADANSEIGAGHIMRCLSIARALQTLGEEVVFIVAEEAAAALLSEQKQAYRLLHSSYNNMEQELKVLLTLLKENGPKLLLLDSYFVTKQYLLQVRQYTKTAYIDDICSFSYPVDILINYNIYGELLPYKKSGAVPRLLLGMDYVPLRAEFRAVSYEVKEKAENVLITTGGSDKYNLAGQILETALADTRAGKLHYHVVSGAFNRYLSGLQEIEETHVNVHIHQNVRNMAELMKQCDIVVTAGGSTMYELCAVGVPIICFSFADNQERLVETFKEKGLACYGGNYLKEKEELPGRVVDYIRLLAESKTQREDYSHRGKRLVDGKGAERIARELTGFTEEN